MSYELPVAPAHVAPELNLLCLALHRKPSPDDRISFAALVRACVDWPKVVAAAWRHSLSSLVLRGLQACGAGVPNEVINELRRKHAQSAGRSLAQLNEVARLTDSFEQAGIPMLVFKGVALSEQLYGDPFFRSANDIDLIVDPARLRAAGDLLIAGGYRRIGRGNSKREFEAYRRHFKELEYVNETASVYVELHHRLTNNVGLLRCDFQDLWRARDRIRVAGVQVATLPRDMLSVYLCVHGVMHGWQRLAWLTDFAATLQGPNAVENAVAQAEKFGLVPLMLHCLALAHVWLGTQIPEKYLRAAVATRQGRTLNRVLAALFSGWFLCGTPPTRAARWKKTWLVRLYGSLAKLDGRYWRAQLAHELYWRGLLARELPERLYLRYWPWPERCFGWPFRLTRRHRETL